MKSIAEVLIRMDEIVSECKSKESRIGYFAVLYRQVTRRIQKGVLNREFEDNPRMETLDILFAKQFINAHELWSHGMHPTKSWDTAFEASKSNNYLAIQYLFLGINAHIHLDLGIATSEPMAGKDLHGIQKDFHPINAFLGELVDGLKANISTVSTIFWWLIPLAKR